MPQDYQSGDVDFIVSWLVDDARIDSVVASIGYSRKGRIYVCPDNRVTLDFPSHDLMIWDEAVTDFNTMRREDLVLYVQTPFDTVRDRLCWFFYDRPDYQAMEVAASVAKVHSVDIRALEAWAARIGEIARFDEFLAYLSG